MKLHFNDRENASLAERPELSSPAEAVPILAQHIGEAGRFVSLRGRGVL